MAAPLHVQALLAQLESTHRVTVNDGSKLWRADGKSFERQYRRAGWSCCAAAVEEAAVETLIRQRTAARRARNYHAADEILEELLDVRGASPCMTPHPAFRPLAS